MQKNVLLRSLLFFLVIYSTTSYAQRYDTLLNTLDTKYPQEKIHLHLDRSYYNAGETIWFKAYIINSNFTTALSTTMYAELLDEKGTLLQRKTMPILQGGAASAFDIPDSTHSSQLFIRAYTAWMLNFDSSLLCVKAIAVVPAKKKMQKQVTDVFTLSLFPEGGDLVENIQSNISFKTNDQNGKPFDVSGIVNDASGKKVTSFSSVHDGMGFFALKPLPREKYTAVWKDKKGVTHTTPFPEIKDQGLVLTASNTSNGLFYTLSRSENASDDYKTFWVVAQISQQPVYAARINMSAKTTITAPINIDSLPSGVLQLTVFNAAQLPVAERLIFINQDNDFSFITDLHAVEKNMSKRSRNTLQIDVGGELRSNLSISVTDADLNPVTKNEETILSDLLLSSDLKGYIYNPAYYFSSDADSVKLYLDLVMMTNGWRRFKWENILAGKWPQIKNQPETYLSIGGNVFGLNKNEIQGKEIIASIKSKYASSSFFTIPIAENGTFNLSGVYFFDTTKVFYQINNDKNKKLTDKASFSFNNNFLNTPTIASSFLQTLPAALQPDSIIVEKSNLLAAIRHSQFEKDKAKTLEIVKVTAKAKPLSEKLDDELTSGLFKGGDARIFTIEGDPSAGGSQTILSYLQGKVAGLQISTSGDGSATWRGSPTSLFLDENNVDMEVLQSINMTDVAMIKIFDPPFFGAMGGGAGGAIAVYSKKGGNAQNANVKGLNTATLYGYSPIREFYSPNYEKTNDPDVADSRNTLYWNPYILMDAKKRRATIPFYTSDASKRIRVVIEGINENGQLTREEKIFE